MESAEPAGAVPASVGTLPVELSLESQADTLGIPFWENPQNQDVSREFVERIPVGFARQHAILAFQSDDTDGERANSTSRVQCSQYA